MTAPRRRKGKHNGPPRAIFYIRVSTEEQARSGLSLEAQHATLEREAERREWDVVAVLVDEGISAKRGKTRPAFEQARAMLAAGEADILASTMHDRMARSTADFTQLVALAQDEGWQIVALNVGVDTTTTSGRLVAHILAAAAEAEREVIGQRTSAALLAKRRRGELVGRRSSLSDELVRHIVLARKNGETLQSIADGLNKEAVPTAQGGARWYASTVAKVLKSQQAERLTAEDARA